MKIKLSILFVFISFSINAQQMSYYYHGEKIDLTVDRTCVNVISEEIAQKSSILGFLAQHFTIPNNIGNGHNNITKLVFNTMPSESEYAKTLNDLKQNFQIQNIYPFFERGDNDPIGTSDIFYVKLKSLQDSSLLKTIAIQHNIQIVRSVMYMPKWHALSIQNSNFSNSIDASTYFYETGFFENINPAFTFNFKSSCSDDPDFSRLWGLSNENYTQGVDINVCDAWSITRGAGVNVAVFDGGIDGNHLDLATNLHSLSFDALNRASPSVFRNASHGTQVAGIIGAIKDNDL